MFSPGLTPPFNDVFKWRSSPLLPVPYTFFCYGCYVDISLTQASFWYCMKYLPGQWRVLHRCESLSVPSQPLPPFAGEGLLHVRDRVCFPPPQRLSQEDQGFHCCQLPWTGISEIRIYKHKAISGRKYRLRWPGWNWFYWWIMESPNVDGKLASHLWARALMIGKLFCIDEENKVLWRLFLYRNE